jgi:hypothetical protein
MPKGASGNKCRRKESTEEETRQQNATPDTHRIIKTHLFDRLKLLSYGVSGWLLDELGSSVKDLTAWGTGRSDGPLTWRSDACIDKSQKVLSMWFLMRVSEIL